MKDNKRSCKRNFVRLKDGRFLALDDEKTFNKVMKESKTQNGNVPLTYKKWFDMVTADFTGDSGIVGVSNDLGVLCDGFLAYKEDASRKSGFRCRPVTYPALWAASGEWQVFGFVYVVVGGVLTTKTVAECVYDSVTGQWRWELL